MDRRFVRLPWVDLQGETVQGVNCVIRKVLTRQRCESRSVLDSCQRAVECQILGLSSDNVHWARFPLFGRQGMSRFVPATQQVTHSFDCHLPPEGGHAPFSSACCVNNAALPTAGINGSRRLPAVSVANWHSIARVLLAAKARGIVSNISHRRATRKRHSIARFIVSLNTAVRNWKRRC